MHALYTDIVNTHEVFFNLCTSGAMLHINMVTCMQLLQSACLPWHLNGICSSLLCEYGVSFHSSICTGMSVFKREEADMPGKRQAGFRGLRSVLPGSEAVRWTVRQPAKPFQLH